MGVLSSCPPIAAARDGVPALGYERRRYSIVVFEDVATTLTIAETHNLLEIP